MFPLLYYCINTAEESKIMHLTYIMRYFQTLRNVSTVKIRFGKFEKLCFLLETFLSLKATFLIFQTEVTFLRNIYNSHKFVCWNSGKYNNLLIVKEIILMLLSAIIHFNNNKMLILRRSCLPIFAWQRVVLLIYDSKYLF